MQAQLVALAMMLGGGLARVALELRDPLPQLLALGGRRERRLLRRPQPLQEPLVLNRRIHRRGLEHADALLPLRVLALELGEAPPEPLVLARGGGSQALRLRGLDGRGALELGDPLAQHIDLLRGDGRVALCRGAAVGRLFCVDLGRPRLVGQLPPTGRAALLQRRVRGAELGDARREARNFIRGFGGGALERLYSFLPCGVGRLELAAAPFCLRERLPQLLVLSAHGRVELGDAPS